MSRVAYTAFLRAAGHRVIETESAVWYDPRPGALTAFPLHREINPTPAELRKLLRRTFLLRYTSADRGIPSYFVGCDQSGYGMESLNSKARNQTRRALEQWQVVQRDGNWLAEHGKPLNRDTLIRQERALSASAERDWSRCCRAAHGRDGFEVWAAVSGPRIGAVALTFVFDEVAYILLQRSATAELPAYPNNALTFTMTQALLSRPAIRLAFYGMRSVGAPASLNHFKAGMGYTRRPVYESFVANRLVRLGLRPARALVLPLLRRFTPAKADALESIFAACKGVAEGSRACLP
jgi:hypothetical protein